MEDDILMHELNVMFGILCKCWRCTARRDYQLMLDMNLYFGCTTAEQVEARRRQYGR